MRYGEMDADKKKVSLSLCQETPHPHPPCSVILILITLLCVFDKASSGLCESGAVPLLSICCVTAFL